MFRLSIPTAQQRFDHMLRARIAPALRARGLKGSGQEFSLPNETHWALLGFQRDRHSDKWHVRFTINVTVVGLDVWATARRAHEWIGERPRSLYGGYLREAEMPGYWHARVGELMPRRKDNWWSLGRFDPSRGLAKDVVKAIDRYVLPAMHERIRSDMPRLI